MHVKDYYLRKTVKSIAVMKNQLSLRLEWSSLWPAQLSLLHPGLGCSSETEGDLQIGWEGAGTRSNGE